MRAPFNRRPPFSPSLVSLADRTSARLRPRLFCRRLQAGIEPRRRLGPALADAVRVFSDLHLAVPCVSPVHLASRQVAFFIDFRYTKSAICMTPSPKRFFDQGRSFCHGDMDVTGGSEKSKNQTEGVTHACHHSKIQD